MLQKLRRGEDATGGRPGARSARTCASPIRDPLTDGGWGHRGWGDHATLQKALQGPRRGGRATSRHFAGTSARAARADTDPGTEAEGVKPPCGARIGDTERRPGPARSPHHLRDPSMQPSTRARPCPATSGSGLRCSTRRSLEQGARGVSAPAGPRDRAALVEACPPSVRRRRSAKGYPALCLANTGFTDR